MHYTDLRFTYLHTIPTAVCLLFSSFGRVGWPFTTSLTPNQRWKVSKQMTVDQ